MSYTRTFSGLIVKKLQYIEEVTYGTLITASPAFTSAGKITRADFNIDAAIERHRILGHRKVVDFLNTGQMTSFELEYKPTNTDLMAYGINDPNGTGTIEKSLTFAFSKKLNGTEFFYFILGARTDQITVEVTKEAVTVTQSFLAKEMTAPVSTANGGLTTPDWADEPTGVPWVGKNGGNNAFTYNSVVWDTPRLSCEVSHNLDPGQPIGHELIKFLDPTNKDCNVEFEVWQKDATFINELKTGARRNLQYLLNTGSSATINITNFGNETYTLQEDANSNETTREPASGGCEDISVTES